MPEDSIDTYNTSRLESLQERGMNLLMTAATQEIPWLLEKVLREPDLSFLENATTYGPQPPKELAGVTINAPFLGAQSDEFIQRAGERVRALGAQNVRMFIDDHNFDPDHAVAGATQAGQIDHALHVLNNGARDGNATYPIGATVDVFDGYILRQAERGEYRSDYETHFKTRLHLKSDRSTN